MLSIANKGPQQLPLLQQLSIGGSNRDFLPGGAGGSCGWVHLVVFLAGAVCGATVAVVRGAGEGSPHRAVFGG